MPFAVTTEIKRSTVRGTGSELFTITRPSPSIVSSRLYPPDGRIPPRLHRQPQPATADLAALRAANGEGLARGPLGQSARARVRVLGDGFEVIGQVARERFGKTKIEVFGRRRPRSQDCQHFFEVVRHSEGGECAEHPCSFLRSTQASCMPAFSARRAPRL